MPQKGFIFKLLNSCTVSVCITGKYEVPHTSHGQVSYNPLPELKQTLLYIRPSTLLSNAYLKTNSSSRNFFQIFLFSSCLFPIFLMFDFCFGGGLHTTLFTSEHEKKENSCFFNTLVAARSSVSFCLPLHQHVEFPTVPQGCFSFSLRSNCAESALSGLSEWGAQFSVDMFGHRSVYNPQDKEEN